MRTRHAAIARATPLALRLLPPTERTAAREIWTDLERRVKDGGLACSWTWTDAWLDHYGDLVPHRFAVVEVAGTPVGAALVTRGVRQRRARLPVRTLHLGTAGEPIADSVYVQRNRLLVEAEYRCAVADTLLGSLLREPGWDEFVLDGFVSDDAQPLLRARPFTSRRELCRTVDLRAAADTGGEVVPLFGPKTRKNFRRSVRGLDVTECEWAETPGQALEILEELIELHQRRWTEAGHPGVFASARFTGFHRELTQRLAPTGGVSLFRVRGRDSPVGCLYGFIEGKRLLSYQSGTVASMSHSPGLVADVLCMQACWERGLEIYDHLSGDSQYKQRLSTGEDTLVWAHARRGWARWAAIDAARALRRLTPRASRQADAEHD